MADTNQLTNIVNFLCISALTAFLAQEGFVEITSPNELCTRYGSLVIANASTINGANFTGILNGSTVPQLCSFTKERVEVNKSFSSSQEMKN